MRRKRFDDDFCEYRVAKRGKSWKCPECGHMCSDLDDFCADCGTMRDEVEEDPDYCEIDSCRSDSDSPKLGCGDYYDMEEVTEADEYFDEVDE